MNGVKDAVSRLFDIPKSLKAKVVFDQSIFVKKAIQNLADEGLIGLVRTELMILLFLGTDGRRMSTSSMTSTKSIIVVI